MKNSIDTTNSLTVDQMKHLAAEHLEEIRKGIAYVNRKCGGILSSDECADLELDGYVKACDGACTYDPVKGNLAGWLWTIGHNTACDLVKKKGLQVRLKDDSTYGADDDEVIRRGLDRLTRSERDQLTIAGWSACEEALSFEQRRRLRLQRECWKAAYQALSDRDQLLLYMRWDLKLCGEEMAREMNLEYVALRVALSRATERFEAELEARHYRDIDEWTSRYFDEDCYLEQEDDETFFGGRSDTNS
jgi:DNA-directed RNA polymerase specialized sigma24 family protein